MGKQYFTREDVAKHNSSQVWALRGMRTVVTSPQALLLQHQDCWLIVFDKVFNLTSLVSKGASEEIMRIIEHAGDDVSVWFDRETGDVSAASGNQ